MASETAECSDREVKVSACISMSRFTLIHANGQKLHAMRYNDDMLLTQTPGRYQLCFFADIETVYTDSTKIRRGSDHVQA